MTACAIDYCEQGNWYSPALMGLHSAVTVEAAARLAAGGSDLVKPYSVLHADLAMNAMVGASGFSQAAVGALSCEDCEALCISLNVKSGGVVGSALSASPYIAQDLTIGLYGLGEVSIDAAVVLHPLGCDWQNSPIMHHDSRAKASCYVEAITSGQVTFMIGDVQLDKCCPCGPHPVWRSGVSWYGVVESVACVNGHSVYWGGAQQDVGAWLSLEAYSVGFSGVDFVASAGLSVDAYTVRWGRSGLGSGVDTGVLGLLIDEAVSLPVPSHSGRSYQPIVRVPLVRGDVLVSLSGVNDVVSLMVGGRVVTHTRRHALISGCEIGDVFVIQAIRESGALIEIKVMVV